MYFCSLFTNSRNQFSELTRSLGSIGVAISAIVKSTFHFNIVEMRTREETLFIEYFKRYSNLKWGTDLQE